MVAHGNARWVESHDQRIRETYPSSYRPGESPGDHLEFALKYDGANLAILAQIFGRAREEDLVASIRSKPGGKYARASHFAELTDAEVSRMEQIVQDSYGPTAGE